MDTLTALCFQTWSCIASAALISASLDAQQPRLSVSPVRSSPGAIVRLTLDPTSTRRDSIIEISGQMGGEPVHFLESESRVWRAIGGIPLGATDSVVARVVVEHFSGAADTLSAYVALPRPRPTTSRGRRRTLSVDSRFTRPLDSATQARIDRENARAREVGRRAHLIPPLWTTPFLRPRPSTITSRFGSGRTFNGSVRSSHLGVVFAGKRGAPVRAANRGVVALVDRFFLAGNVVYIDHGGGVVTGYFHLTKALVSPGDTVARGQRIGLVGATGRVTGPHLHWSARYGGLTVNPLDLLALGGWYRGR